MTCGLYMSEAGLWVHGYGFHTSTPASARPGGYEILPLIDPLDIFFHHTLLHLIRVPVGLAGDGYPLPCCLGASSFTGLPFPHTLLSSLLPRKKFTQLLAKTERFLSHTQLLCILIWRGGSECFLFAKDLSWDPLVVVARQDDAGC
jgi:hypothetical protein